MRPNLDDQVTGRPAAPPSVPALPLPAKPNPLAVARASLDAELQRFTLGNHTLAIAGGANILDLAGAVAAWALNVELHAAAHLGYLAGAVALRALDAATGGRLPLAGRAGLLPLNLQPSHTSADR